jgi:DnaJ like chaperone protein
MAKYGKWIGGGLGWVLGGPIGGLIGFMFGSMFDGIQTSVYQYQSPGEGGGTPYGYGGTTASQTQTGDFTISLLVLAASVMKADGRVAKSELEYVRTFLNRQFGTEVTNQNILMLHEMLQKDFDVREVSQQIGRYMDYSSKLQLLHFLFGISQADGFTHEAEIDVIENISRYINIETGDFNSIKAMFVKDNFKNYKILEVTPDANNDELKKAYRKMATKYHPDKVSHLGADIQNAAKEKFQELNAAYEEIKKERGIV